MVNVRPVAKKLHERTDDGLVLGQAIYEVSLFISADWMDGELELRFPEVLQSSMGMHYLDHFSPEIKPMSEPNPFPQWKTDAETGVMSYSSKLAEGLEFGASARLSSEVIDIGFWVTNKTGQTLDFVEVNPCFMLMGSSNFPDRKQENFYISIDGELKQMSETTPTPKQLNREPWVTVLMKEQVGKYNGERDTHMWWMVDQVSDENLMIAVSDDKKHLVGYTWNTRPEVLMNNFKHPCMHTGPGKVKGLENGQTAEMKGKIWLMENDLQKCLEIYKEAHQSWS